MNNIDGTTLRIWVKLGYPGRVSSSSGNGQSSEKVVFEEKGAQRAYGQCKHILTNFWDRRCLAVNQFIMAIVQLPIWRFQYVRHEPLCEQFARQQRTA